MTNTITLSEVYASTYSLKNGKLLSSTKTKTLSKLQTVLNELDIQDRNVYLKCLRLIRSGKTIAEAIAEVLNNK